MGVQERRAREKQELRQEILDAARDLFVREGFENISMRKIADQIEYSPTTIYLYFRDKADLLDCICEETLAKLDRKLTSIEHTTDDPLESLRKGLRAYIDFGLKHPNDYRVAFMTEVKEFTGPENCPRCHVAGQKAFDHMRTGVRQCIEAGVFAPRDPETVSQALWAAIHGITALLITRCRFSWVDQQVLIDTLIDTLIDGNRLAR